MHNCSSPSPTPSSITTITFDVGSTLIRPRSSYQEVFYDTEVARGHNVPLSEITAHIKDMDALYVKKCEATDGNFWCNPKGASQIWIDMYTYLSQFVGLSDDAEGIAHDFYSKLRTAKFWKPYEDVLETLKTLSKQKYKLGIISNWGSELNDILRELGLAQYFSVFSISADVGMRKPDPKIFLSTLDRLHSTPSQTVHIGDLPKIDGNGAHAVGIHPVIIDRESAIQECSYPVVVKLTQLPDLLKTYFPHQV